MRAICQVSSCVTLCYNYLCKGYTGTKNLVEINTHKMTTLGQNLSLETRQKISLAKTKDRTELHKKIEEYILALTEKDFPSITRAAIYAGISEKALLAYELRTGENSEVRILLDTIRDLAKATLMENGLNKKFDARLSSFLLQANHGLKTEPTHLEQNNIFNVSPEILAEAIQLTRSPKK